MLDSTLKSSTTYAVSNGLLGDGDDGGATNAPISCCEKSSKSSFDPYFKSEVSMTEMCYR